MVSKNMENIKTRLSFDGLIFRFHRTYHNKLVESGASGPLKQFYFFVGLMSNYIELN